MTTQNRKANIGVAIDDYGTGYSTVKQLQKLPFNELKLINNAVPYLTFNIAEVNLKLGINLLYPARVSREQFCHND